uniref:KANL3/Tex30 alpha/beta hydrolase-like domain-containing protein n=1 Tax=Coccolithus braarudii TaxID=221442 RepID=A0A7S0LCZ5_9EUKA
MKDRRGSNKNKTGTRTARKQGKTKNTTARVAKTKKKQVGRIAAIAARLPSRAAFERSLVNEPQTRRVGRAIVLLHGAGGSSAHASMRAWKSRLSGFCDEVLSVDFPKGDERDLTKCVTAAAARALDVAHKHKRVVLVGVGAGGRTALNLLAAAEGNALGIEPLGTPLREAIVGVVALSFQLLRSGSRECRDECLRSLSADAPPLLFVSGARDAKMDTGALESARCASGARLQLYTVEGADHALKPPSESGVEALDAALAAFIGEAFGPKEETSVEIAAAPAQPHLPSKGVAVSRKRARAVEPPAIASAAIVHQEHQPDIPKAQGKTTYIEVSGAGSPEVEGIYRHHGIRDGVPCYKQVSGVMTIERDSGTQWCICRNFGFSSWYFVNSEARTPPTNGWSSGESAPPAPVMCFKNVQLPSPAQL